MGKLRIRLPEEVGGREFEIFDPAHPPLRICDQRARLMGHLLIKRDGNIDLPLSVVTEIEAMCLREMVVSPKFTPDFLASDECNASEVAFLKTYFRNEIHWPERQDYEMLRKKLTVL